MAAVPSNKSSSSFAAPPSRANPNLRNSEISNPIRRSFTGNPFQKPSVIANPRSFNPNTPANSPSDFPRRNSIGGRESMGSLRDLDDKENRKDQILKPAKLRSPASSTTKSTKNFMSPTISASSKITESPRKKVLIERNEAARTSFNSTEVKSPARKVTFAETVDYSDSKSEIGLQENDEFQPILDGIVKEETERLPASMVSEDFISDEALNPKTETESLFETVTDEPDYVNLDPTFNLSPTPPPISSTSTIIAPLDADPLIPPYDPKRNYLSPRPQFLHYKPNPRVELYKERENMNLEDSFSSDTEVTEDAMSDNLSEKGSDDASSNEVVSEEQHLVSEPSPITSTMQEEEVTKPGFSFRSKSIIALVLLLSVAFISITNTNSPVFNPTAFKDLTIVSGAYDWSEISQLARTNFDRFSEIAKASFEGLNRDLHIWFTKSMSSISELISTFRGVNNLGHLQYWNLTVLQEDMEVNHFPIFGRGEIGEAPHVDLPVLNVEENEDSADTYSDEINAGGISEEHFEEQEVQEEEQVPPMSNRHEDDATEEIDTYEESIGDISAHEEREVQQDVEVESASATLYEEVALVGQSATVIESESAMSEPSQSDIGSQTSEIHTELSGASNLEAKQTPENDASLNMDLKDQPLLNSEGAEHNDEQQPESNSEINSEVFHDVQWKKEGEKSPSFEAIISASLLLFLSIVAGTTFKWLRKKDEGRKTVATAATTITSSVEKKPFLVNFKDEQQASLDKPFLRNNGPIEMDDVLGGESYPSEMSSFENSSSYYSQKVVMKEQNEAQSVEKKPKKSSSNRRESLASSDYSVGSLSYGSFTTYEKLSSKNGHGDAKTITPVRRSSRIKNLATSP